MSLAEALAAVERDSGSTGCGITRLLTNLPDPDRDALLAALARSHREAPATEIARVLRTHGHQISESVIQRHRRGTCCPKETNA